MKLARIGLAIVTSLVLMLSVCLPVQADEENGSVDISATVPLVISDVSASGIGYYEATISWNTNGDATSQVFYDTEFHDNIDHYADHTDVDTAPISGHSVRLTGLSLGRTYHYRVRSAIPNTEFEDISEEDYTFRTSSRAPSPPPGPPAPPPAPPLGTTDVRGMVGTGCRFLESVPIISEDGLCTLTIPAGTVGLTEELACLTRISMVIMDEPPEPPKDAYVIGLAYDLGPDGATFDPPITLTFSYELDALPEGVAWLVIAYYDEETGEWVELPCIVDPVNQTITASVAHFTTFAIIGTVPPVPPPPPVPAVFTFSSLVVLPSQVARSEEVNISVLVANTGGESGSYSVVLKINGVKEQEKSVTIAAGGSKTVSFSVTREEADSYTVAVNGLSGSFTVAPVVIPPEPAAFSVAYLSFSPLEVEPGEAVTITVLVANIGGESGSYTVALKIDGVKEAEETVTLAAGESQDVSFSVTREEPGNYAVTVDRFSGSFTVLLPIEPPGVNWPLNGGIIAAVVVVAGLLIYFLVFRRSTLTKYFTKQ